MSRQPHRRVAARPPKSDAKLLRAIRLRLGRASELLQEAEVVLEVVAQVVYRVAQVADPLDAHAEREALVALGIEAARLEHHGVDHAGAEDRHPARPRAGGAADAAADDALDVEG